MRKLTGNHIYGIIIIAILLVLNLSYGPAHAQPVNFGFETGDLTGWTTQGNVEVLQGTNFIPNITPHEGKYFVLLSTGFGDSPAPDNGDLDGDGNPDYDVTILSKTFTSGHETISFSWSWLTFEETVDAHAQYDDFFLVRLDGSVILSGSVDRTPAQSPFPDVPTNDIAYLVNSPGTPPGPTDQSYFGDGRSEFQTFTRLVTPGTHTIEFIVADAGDEGVDSGLLIDGIPDQTRHIPPDTIPIGGYLLPVEKLDVLMPYLIIAGFIGAISIVLTIKRKLKTNV